MKMCILGKSKILEFGEVILQRIWIILFTAKLSPLTFQLRAKVAPSILCSSLSLFFTFLFHYFIFFSLFLLVGG